jgi:hypothetical protein
VDSGVASRVVPGWMSLGILVPSHCMVRSIVISTVVIPISETWWWQDLTAGTYYPIAMWVAIV